MTTVPFNVIALKVERLTFAPVLVCLLPSDFRILWESEC